MDYDPVLIESLSLSTYAPQYPQSARLQSRWAWTVRQKWPSSAASGIVVAAVVDLDVDDVAETVACSREMTRRKLHSLEDRGDVASRKTASRAVWWLVDDHGPTQGVHVEDPLWEFEPGASGESGVSARVDEVLYGEDST